MNTKVCDFFHNGYLNSKEHLENILTFKDEVLTYYVETDEKMHFADLYGKTVQITPHQFGEVYEVVKKICNSMNLKLPNIFIYEDFYYGIETKGITNPWIEISAKTLKDFDIEELTFLIARQLYKIWSEANKIDIIAIESMKLVNTTNILPLNDSLVKTLTIRYSKWSRLLNYTMDNYGYYYTKNLKKSVNAILYLILNNTDIVKNMNILSYVNQADNIGELCDNVSIYTKADEKIPYGSYRIKNLLLNAIKELE